MKILNLTVLITLIAMLISSCSTDEIRDDNLLQQQESTEQLLNPFDNPLGLGENNAESVCLIEMVCVSNPQVDDPEDGFCYFDIRGDNFFIYDLVRDYYESIGAPNGPITNLVVSYDFEVGQVICIPGQLPTPGLSWDITPNATPWPCSNEFGWPVYLKIPCDTGGTISFTYYTASGGPFDLPVSASCPYTNFSCSGGCCSHGLKEHEVWTPVL